MTFGERCLIVGYQAAPEQVPPELKPRLFLSGGLIFMHANSMYGPYDPSYPLYDPRWEHDACGTGFVAQVSGEASHHLIEVALQALVNLTHRGAQDADSETSDGAGLLTQIPTALFCAELQARNVSLPDPDDLAAGMIFLPSPPGTQSFEQSQRIIEQTCIESGLIVLGWREPP